MPLPVVAAFLLATAVSPDSTGEAVLRAMHERYEGKWPRAVTFVQTTSIAEGDSTRVETWYEAIDAPARLRIDFAPVEEGSGVIFRNDSVYQFKSDSLVTSVRYVHPLLVLTRDVYFLPPEEVLPKLRDLHFELSKVHEETWQGRPAYVVGAEAGDLTSPQFWVDKERLIFVRMLGPAQQDPTKTEDVRFDGYRELGGGWIETEVAVVVNGKKVFSESYADIREAKDLTSNLFDPARWERPAWVKERS